MLTLGEVAERSNAAVLKTVEGRPSGGSNPSLSASYHLRSQEWVEHSFVSSRTKGGRDKG